MLFQLIAASLVIVSVHGLSVQEELKSIDFNDLAPYAALHGLNLTTVRVVTPDGWVLNIHRVRNPDIFDPQYSTPVFMLHGIGCASIDYMANPRNESLAFLLADRGFDVWAANLRGNQFSEKVIVDGVEKEPSKERFYKATWQYMAEFDFPTVFDKILDVTGHSKVYVIGQSMGATTTFAALSENHKYDDKIGHFVAIVPVIKMTDGLESSLRIAVKAAPTIPKLILTPVFPYVFGQDLADVVPSSNFRTFACKRLKTICDLLFGFLFNVHKLDAFNEKHLIKERIPLYVHTYPSGMVFSNMYLFAKQYGLTNWTKMNYEEIPQTKIENQDEYGQDTPPTYDFTAVNVSFSIEYSGNDVFTSPDTAREVVKQLDLSSKNYRIHDCNKLNHHETLWGWDARCCMYDSILDRFEQIELDRKNSALSSYRKKVRDYVTNDLKDDNQICIDLRNDPAYDPE